MSLASEESKIVQEMLSRMKKNQNNLYSFSNVIIIDCFDTKNVIRFSKLRVTLKHILQNGRPLGPSGTFWESLLEPPGAKSRPIL